MSLTKSLSIVDKSADKLENTRELIGEIVEQKFVNIIF